MEVVKGDLLELSVGIDGQKVIDTNRFWYPLPSSLVRRTRELLGSDEFPRSVRRPQS